jgi:hypothetical protein
MIGAQGSAARACDGELKNKILKIERLNVHSSACARGRNSDVICCRIIFGASSVRIRNLLDHVATS